MQVDILYFEDCPNSDAALDHVRQALSSEGAVADVRMVEIRDTEDAIARRFLGSPTIQIDGEDAESEARRRIDYGFMCRTYRAPDGSVSGSPPVDLIAQALRDRLGKLQS
jgi:hypothetical protein